MVPTARVIRSAKFGSRKSDLATRRSQSTFRRPSPTSFDSMVKRSAAVLALASSAHAYMAPHVYTVCDGRCAAPVANILDSAKAAWLAKLDTPSWGRGSVVPTAPPVLHIPEALAAFTGPAATTDHEFIGIEDVFGAGFAECFHSSPQFRTDLIGCAMDIGSLFSRGTPWAEQTPEFDQDGCRRRVGDVLKWHLGATAPTADEFVGAFSALCGDGFRWGSFTCFQGKKPPEEVQMDTFFERKLPVGALEWHQDWAAAEISHMFGESRTVMFAFPAAGSSDHEGTGLFTELVKLTHEFSTETLKVTASSYQGRSTDEQDRMAAAELGVSDEHIVRPYYGRGREMLRYKDSEYLHRSPRGTSDPAGRSRQAIWRFQ